TSNFSYFTAGQVGSFTTKSSWLADAGAATTNSVARPRARPVRARRARGSSARGRPDGLGGVSSLWLGAFGSGRSTAPVMALLVCPLTIGGEPLLTTQPTRIRACPDMAPVPTKSMRAVNPQNE